MSQIEKLQEKELKKLYKKFLKFDKFYEILDNEKYSTTLKELRLPKKVLEDFYENYRKVPFFTFLKHVKDLIYSKSVFDFITKNSLDDWTLWRYLEFLKNEGWIKVERAGSISLLKKDVIKIIPGPKTEEEIKMKIEKKLRTKIKEKEPVINLFKFQDFVVKAKWDQMPISVGSAIFVTKKILEYLPLNRKFLLVGDDDFISVILTVANPNIECLVIDTDEQLLECIDIISSEFNLNIETRNVDIREKKVLRKKFVGFLTNPVYTESGVKEFVRYGKNQLGKDGGIGFLEIGNEIIGNGFLFLQEFFAKNNLIVEEVIPNRIYYPHIMLYEEDEEILRRLSSIIDEKIIKKSPKLGASLYVFQYLPWKPKRIKFKRSIYAYL